MVHRIAIFIGSFTVLAVISACGTFASSDKETATRMLELGTSQLQSGSYPQALATLLKAEALDGNNPVIENNLGLAYYVREHYSEAETHIRKAIEIEPTYTDAHNNLGRTLIELTRYPEAISELTIASKDLTYMSPDKPLLNLGIAYFKMNRYNYAEVYFLKSLDIQRDNCLAHTYLGRSFYEEKKYTKATQELDRATAFCQKSQFDEPVYYAAMGYFQQGQVEIASGRLSELLKLYPNGKYRDKAKALLEDMRR